MSDLLDRDVRFLLEAIADEQPTPGGGSVAALVTAMAAALIVMATRRSPDWPEAKGIRAQASALAARAAPLAQQDADAYESALRSLAGDSAETRPEARDFALGNALAKAAHIPLAIAAIAADVAELASTVAEAGDQSVRADAAAAAALAQAAARAAANVVAVNLTVTADDVRVQHAEQLAAAAASAADRALASGS